LSFAEKWMRRALELARKGEGMTRPNPPVGAVIVKDGEKVAEGYHRKAGESHAEVNALAAAGKLAENAEMFVTLEPCSTQGRTPPCTDAIIRAGVKKVTVAVSDKNPKHRGRGLEILRSVGIEVVEGVCSAEAETLLEPFSRWVSSGIPWLTLKLGMSIDGRIADRCGASKWITSSEAREEVQSLRRRADAVMVGVETVLADDPSLLPRPAFDRKPFRIVLDSRGRLPESLKIFTDGHAEQTIVATTAGSAEIWREKIRTSGAQVWTLPAEHGRVSARALMKRLGECGLLCVLCEGGSGLAGTLVHEGIIDEYIFFIAPCLIGGDGVPAVGGDGWLLAEKREFEVMETCRVGADVMIRVRDKN